MASAHGERLKYYHLYSPFSETDIKHDHQVVKCLYFFPLLADFHWKWFRKTLFWLFYWQANSHLMVCCFFLGSTWHVTTAIPPDYFKLCITYKVQVKHGSTKVYHSCDHRLCVVNVCKVPEWCVLLLVCWVFVCQIVFCSMKTIHYLYQQYAAWIWQWTSISTNCLVHWLSITASIMINSTATFYTRITRLNITYD